MMPRQNEISIDLSALEALPDKGNIGTKINWTPELDAALLKYWPVKNHEQIAKILGMCQGTCKARYRQLTEQ
jgi:hypothetical protein